MDLLPSMITYLIENGCKSIISRIYGIYKVTYSGMQPIFLMLQKNNIKIQPGNSLNCLFDLKGSKCNRQVIPIEEIRNIQNHSDDTMPLETFENQSVCKGVSIYESVRSQTFT